jgi:hypothetical protein
MRPSRVAAMVALVVVAVLAVATGRELSVGQVEVAAADAAADRSDWPEAVLHARAAAEALVPGSPWPARGWARLEAIGHDAEARGDDPTALLAYGAMRAAALATRAPGAGADAWRRRADEGLARVASSARTATGPHVASDAMLDALRDTEPPPTWILTVLAAAGVAMLAGLGRIAWTTAPAEERLAQALAGVGFAAYAIVLLVT